MTDLQKDTISVLVPIYNGERFLKTTLNQILRNASSEYNLQIIALNNNSSDTTSEILEHYSNDIKIYSNNDTLSPGQNWTRISRLATGQYTTLICADDYILKDSISKKYNIIKNNDIDFVFSSRGVIDKNDNIILKSISSVLKSGLYSGKDILDLCIKYGTNLIGEPFSVLFKTSTLIDNLPWEDEYPYLLDLSLYTKILKRNRYVFFTEENLGFFRVHDMSMSSQISNDQAIQFYNFINQQFDTSYRVNLLNLKIKTVIRQQLRSILYLYINFLSFLPFKRRKIDIL